MEENYADNLDLEDIDYGQEEESIINDSQDNEESYIEESDINNDDFDLTEELLKLQGITDINKIKFEDESGAIVERSWNTLTNNEKLMILSHQEDPDTSLDDAEIELINQIRESGLNPDQYIQNLLKQEVSTPTPTYEVDEMSDDELFCLDLLDKVGSENISDEELQQALDNAKSNENLYRKQVASLRVYYKGLEENRQTELERQKQEQAEYEFNVFSNNIVNSIRNFNLSEDIPVELSNEEMEDLANYILTRDASGYSEFGRLLNDPKEFTKAAFWTFKGQEILNEMQNQIKEAYLRGYNDSHKPSSNKKVFVKSSQHKNVNNNGSSYASFDEDSYLND